GRRCRGGGGCRTTPRGSSRRGVAGDEVGRGREERDHAAVAADGGVGTGVVGLAARAVEADSFGRAGLPVPDKHVGAAAGAVNEYAPGPPPGLVAPATRVGARAPNAT